VEELEDDVRQGQRFGGCENSDFFSGFGVRNSEKAESVLELGLLEGVAYSNCEVGLCAVPRSPIAGAKEIDEIDVHPISLVLLKFL